MGLDYQLVLWNKDKKVYDRIIIFFMLLYLILFIGITFFTNKGTSLETLIIRAFGSLSIVLLHVILVIGPLARINPKFLPILYNRRHLGVSMFLIALIHGVFSIIQFHTLGNTNAIYSVFTSNMDYFSIVNFPFQTLGFLALIILFFMAATSHDFWLSNLKPLVWKRLHMLVYVAYVLIVFHVFLGAFQQETSLLSTGILVIGFVIVSVLHLVASLKEISIDKTHNKVSKSLESWLLVCTIDEIVEDRAKIFIVGNERVAIFKYEGKLSAIHNVCKHQGGPLGEGKVVDGCVTCPWHGYQYLPHNGQSPPPFTEMVSTYELKLVGNDIYINPMAFEEGCEIKPIEL